MSPMVSHASNHPIALLFTHISFLSIYPSSPSQYFSAFVSGTTSSWFTTDHWTYAPSDWMKGRLQESIYEAFDWNKAWHNEKHHWMSEWVTACLNDSKHVVINAGMRDGGKDDRKKWRNEEGWVEGCLDGWMDSAERKTDAWLPWYV